MEDQIVRLKCVKEGNRLRVKIISPGYNQSANCQFPATIRLAGREYTVPASNVKMADTRGKFFYRINKNNITIEEPTNESAINKGMKVYGDAIECSICMDDIVARPEMVFIIFVPCGHYCCCMDCGKMLKTCCMCRAVITQVITKEQLQ